MALESFNAYHSYLKAMEPLNDAEASSSGLIDADYTVDGETGEIKEQPEA